MIQPQPSNLAELAILHAPVAILVLKEDGLCHALNNEASLLLGLDYFDASEYRNHHLDELLNTNLLVGGATFRPLLDSLDCFKTSVQMEIFCNSRHLLSRMPKKRILSASKWLGESSRFYYTVVISDEINPNLTTVQSTNSVQSTEPLLKRRKSFGTTARAQRSKSVSTTASSIYTEDFLVWESFQFVCDSLDTPMWLANKDGEAYWWSEKWISVFSQSGHNNVHPDDQVRFESQMSRFFILRKSFEVLHRLYCAKKNDWRWYKMRCSPVMHPRIKGKCLKWVGVLEDVHHQVIAVEEAELAREQLMMVINKAGLYLYIYDKSLVCKDFYGPTSENFRLHRAGDTVRRRSADHDAIECTIGASMQDLWFEDQTPLIQLSKSVLNGEVPQAQIDIQERGEWYRCKLAGVRDLETGETQSLVMFNTKVTELKKSEADVHSSRVEVEVARQSSAQKSQFLANMSHEIRTPIAGILGLCEILKDTMLTGFQMDHLQSITHSAESLLTVINDILDFSKIEAGKMSIEVIAFDLKECVEAAIGVVKFVAAKRSIEVVLDYQLPAGQVRGDPTRIRQILLNLMSNAVKFSHPNSTVKVTATVVHQASSYLQVEFAVCDHGEGIAPEKLKTLFQPFSQADASTTRRFGGTGLGLVICSQLVALMGGSIELESQIGLGSRARYQLSLKKVSRQDLQNITRQRTLSDERLRVLTKAEKRILLAEDNAVNRTIAIASLKKLGFTNVLTAENGKIACDMVAVTKEPFDLILMDCQMPERDGYEATKVIRAAHFNVPIVAMTASAIQGDKELCLSSGMNDYLSKPVKPMALEAMLLKWLKPTFDHRISFCKQN